VKFLTLLAAALLFAAPALAQESKEDLKARINQYLEAGKTGVFYSETHDLKDGSIVRLFAVGKATISNALGAEEGLELAQEKAEEAAKSAFVTFLNGKVAVRKSSNNEVILTKEGEEGNVRESGKIVEKRTKEFEETAGSIVRGLKVVAVDQRTKEKVYIVVYRWEARAASAAKSVDDELNKPKKK